MHNFKELRIWQDSIDLVEDIYLETKNFPKNEEYGLTSQMRRCSVSVPSNIAEGSGRGTDKDFKRFLSISLSSSFELETQLIIANRLGFIESKNFEKSAEKVRKLQKMIFTFRKKMGTIVKLKSFILLLFV
jgi:four helix bundle protein